MSRGKRIHSRTQDTEKWGSADNQTKPEGRPKLLTTIFRNPGVCSGLALVGCAILWAIILPINAITVGTANVHRSYLPSVMGKGSMLAIEEGWRC
jgi:hypothetical protein